MRSVERDTNSSPMHSGAPYHTVLSSATAAANHGHGHGHGPGHHPHPQHHGHHHPAMPPEQAFPLAKAPTPDHLREYCMADPMLRSIFHDIENHVMRTRKRPAPLDSEEPSPASFASGTTPTALAAAAAAAAAVGTAGATLHAPNAVKLIPATLHGVGTVDHLPRLGHHAEPHLLMRSSPSPSAAGLSHVSASANTSANTNAAATNGGSSASRAHKRRNSMGPHGDAVHDDAHGAHGAAAQRRVAAAASTVGNSGTILPAVAPAAAPAAHGAPPLTPFPDSADGGVPSGADAASAGDAAGRPSVLVLGIDVGHDGLRAPGTAAAAVAAPAPAPAAAAYMATSGSTSTPTPASLAQVTTPSRSSGKSSEHSAASSASAAAASAGVPSTVNVNATGGFVHPSARLMQHRPSPTLPSPTLSPTLVHQHHALLPQGAALGLGQNGMLPAAAAQLPAAPSPGSAAPHPLHELPRMLSTFEQLGPQMKNYMLFQLLRRCAHPSLQFLNGIIAPTLKRDFLRLLPFELCQQVLQNLDARSLARCAIVSKGWRAVVEGRGAEITVWKRRLVERGWLHDDEVVNAYNTYRAHYLQTVGTAEGAEHAAVGGAAMRPRRHLATAFDLEADSDMDMDMDDVLLDPDAEDAAAAAASGPQQHPQPPHRTLAVVRRGAQAAAAAAAAGGTPLASAPMPIAPVPAEEVLERVRRHFMPKSEARRRRERQRGHERPRRHSDARRGRSDSLSDAEVDDDSDADADADGRASASPTSSGSDALSTSSSALSVVSSSGSVASLASTASAHLFPPRLYKSLYRRHHIIQQNWNKGRCERTSFPGHGSHVVTCLQFDADKIVSGSDDQSIHIYSTKGHLLQRLTGHDGGVWALQYWRHILVSGSTDRSVRVWDMDRGVNTHTFEGHTSTVRCLMILIPRPHCETGVLEPPEPLIVTGSRDTTLRVWRLPDPHTDPGWDAAAHAGEDRVNPWFKHVLAGHEQSVRAIAGKGRILVSGSYDHTVRIWDVMEGRVNWVCSGHTQKVYSVGYCEETARAVSGSMDMSVRVWCTKTGTALFNLEGHSNLVGLLELSPHYLVTAAADWTLRIWNPMNGQCLARLKGHTAAITCFHHDPALNRIVSGSEGGVKVWELCSDTTPGPPPHARPNAGGNPVLDGRDPLSNALDEDARVLAGADGAPVYGRPIGDIVSNAVGVWRVRMDEERLVCAVQKELEQTFFEVLDFSDTACLGKRTTALGDGQPPAAATVAAAAAMLDNAHPAALANGGGGAALPPPPPPPQDPPAAHAEMDATADIFPRVPPDALVRALRDLPGGNGHGNGAANAPLGDGAAADAGPAPLDVDAIGHALFQRTRQLLRHSMAPPQPAAGAGDAPRGAAMPRGSSASGASAASASASASARGSRAPAAAERAASTAADAPSQMGFLLALTSSDGASRESTPAVAGAPPAADARRGLGAAASALHVPGGFASEDDGVARADAADDREMADTPTASQAMGRRRGTGAVAPPAPRTGLTAPPASTSAGLSDMDTPMDEQPPTL